MNFADPQMLYVALILPSLFALTFLADGVHKLMKSEPPWVPLITGTAFLVVIIAAYFFVLK